MAKSKTKTVTPDTMAADAVAAQTPDEQAESLYVDQMKRGLHNRDEAIQTAFTILGLLMGVDASGADTDADTVPEPTA
jgi:hypothetical protein